MSPYNTYSTRAADRTQTLNRRAIRRAKYASAPLDTF